MMMQQTLNPMVTFGEPTKEFLHLNGKSDKLLFDIDLEKHLSLVKRPPAP
jgi:hypothetical protein